MTDSDSEPDIVLSGPSGRRFDEVLTPEALRFLARLHRQFDTRRGELMARREARQMRFDEGESPDFLSDTKETRNGDWRVAPIPDEVLDRRVEMTGPVERRALIEGLNSKARVYMADFEDGTAPAWSNLVEGQINIHDRWRDRLTHDDPQSGQRLTLSPKPAVLMTRPRGWHLPEAHVKIDGEPIAGALFDFGLTLFHNAEAILAKGSHPYFYLPKLEGLLGARLWNDVFAYSEDALGLPAASIKATVLIETLPAAFQMHEILYELRDRAIGLTCGRWDYIFSIIKIFRTRRAYLLPDRNQLDMGGAFLKAYSELLIRTCHRRGALALGGMSAYIPVDDGARNTAMLTAVRVDKEREAEAGHDGTWVAHPALIPLAEEVFDRLMPGPNQLSRPVSGTEITQFDLLEMHDGIRTEQGLRDNIRTGVQYLEAWLRGEGAVPLDGVVEDAAIAEISRAQIWQQLHFSASLAEGKRVTPALFSQFLLEEMEKVKIAIGEDVYQKGRFADAIALFTELSMAEELQPFLTSAAYPMII